MKTPIHPCLWFDTQAKEAADYYCTIFPSSKILSENPIVVSFELNGTRFMGLNGGPKFTFNESVSFVIECEDQAEIDHYWSKLTQGGEESMCGWLKDKFGISWQVVPAVLPKLMNDPLKSQKVMEVFMKMRKFDIETLLSV